MPSLIAQLRAVGETLVNPDSISTPVRSAAGLCQEVRIAPATASLAGAYAPPLHSQPLRGVEGAGVIHAATSKDWALTDALTGSLAVARSAAPRGGRS